MRVLIKPIITEKATAESEAKNRYAFVVDIRANKLQIKKAVEVTYGISVDKVRTMNYGARRKAKYTKTGIQNAKIKAYKKALVDVAEGNTIDFYSNI